MRCRVSPVCSLLGSLAMSTALCTGVHAQGFAALVSPPRFELSTKPGKTLRGVIEISNRSTTPGRYVVHTADWDLSPDYSVNFHDDLQPGSCRPWVSIERPEIVVPGAGTLRYRFEAAVPADAAPGECRFAVMIEGAEPSIARSKGLDVPVTGRIGVIVYIVVGDAAADLEILGPKIETLNGKSVPTLRVHNGGDAHGRVGGFLTGTDAKGVTYDFTPSDFPILPREEREVFLTPSTPRDDHPTLAFPVTVKGTLEWGNHRVDINQLFQ
jgi:fimbrial chaperone protein